MTAFALACPGEPAVSEHVRIWANWSRHGELFLEVTNRNKVPVDLEVFVLRTNGIFGAGDKLAPKAGQEDRSSLWYWTAQRPGTYYWHARAHVEPKTH